MTFDWVVFTDLDGTLLDYHTYSFSPAIEALDLLKREGIPLCIVTSKTRAEIEEYRRLLHNTYPFISENGGGIFIPRGYFHFPFPYNREDEKYQIIELGERHDLLLNELIHIKKDLKIDIKPLSLLSKEEIISITGLKPSQVDLLMKREYDEPFLCEVRFLPLLLDYVKAKELKIIKGGRFFHLLGNHDKGKAVEILIKHYKKVRPHLKTMALGEGENDLPMLKAVDVPILIRRFDGSCEETIVSEFQSRLKEDVTGDLILAKGIGPTGWNRAVLDIIGA